MMTKCLLCTKQFKHIISHNLIILLGGGYCHYPILQMWGGEVK